MCAIIIKGFEMEQEKVEMGFASSETVEKTGVMCPHCGESLVTLDSFEEYFGLSENSGRASLPKREQRCLSCGWSTNG